ncbi:hypothetical protein A2230_02695 [candidate division WOR-1 bacterium RIFOXYA2_FULL_36_21]|uniref:DUF2914 domain-containing protein n=1 Tax=candidate division WOR-1 bacterium RIFOXYB2_FULL_36_35 TaxID=1802578 RepID=A0A1F4RXG8_UNCSA|nr:MAG: hypothetical protein A2230_02695 [candidate division WOR-1 bacterium RIFOXYA2_FULL_36_21]OGC12864.1 MAG: hypothetical protein A2290_02745 [candidate division WOR-1 bacterium RIFOXYB2_FULL_36_35]OGC19936.1 MAG: hypothetical protein A2282_02695 [candidate division WOR-1 bacterium RIFOXYA12_FULL_36_13]
MSDFVGYTKRPEPKWPYFVLFATVIIVLLLAFSINSDTKKKQSQTKSTTTIDKTKELAQTQEKKKEETNIIAPQQNHMQKIKDEIKVKEISFTNKINNYHMPTDNISSVSKTKDGMLYCYTKINSPVVPTTIRHVWINPNKEVHADIKLTLIKQSGNIWSYIGTGEKQTGKWKVLVKDVNGNVLAEEDILIKD